MTTTTITRQQAIDLGGKPWTPSNGGAPRIYLNDAVWAELIGFEVRRYNTGNISDATIGGDHISNIKANELLCTKVWVEGDTLHVRTRTQRMDEYATLIRSAVVAAAAALA